MGKGILMEVEGRTGVVLTPKGEFRRVPLPKGALDIGDEIEFQESAGLRLWIAAAAAVLLMALSPFAYQQWALAQPAALVQIDINPSIQLTLNGRQQVIAAQGLNADGEQVLEGLSLYKLPVDEATRKITARAVAMGKLDPAAETSAVVVAVAPAGEEELSEEAAGEIAARSKIAVQTEVREQAEAKGEAARTQVAALEATKEEVELAREQGITLPKLIILQEVKESHPEVTAEAIAKVGPGKFVHSLGLNPGDIFSKAEKKHNKGHAAEPASSRGNGKQSEDDKPGAAGGDDDKGGARSGEKANPSDRGDREGKESERERKEPDREGKESERERKESERGRKEQDRADGEKAERKEKKSDDSSDKERDETGEKGFLERIKERLGIGGSSDRKPAKKDRGSDNREEGESNRSRGGQEKGDERANEGRGRGKD